MIRGVLLMSVCTNFGLTHIDDGTEKSSTVDKVGHFSGQSGDIYNKVGGPCLENPNIGLTESFSQQKHQRISTLSQRNYLSCRASLITSVWPLH